MRDTSRTEAQDGDPGPRGAPQPAAGRGGRAVRDATAQLLDPVMYRPVQVRPGPAVGRIGVTVQLLVAAALGVLTVAAVGSLRAPEPSDVSARGLLVSQIQERAANAEARAADNRAINQEITALQAELLSATDRGLVTRLEQSSLLAGTVAVAGPGLVVELDDPVAPEEGLSAESRVQDVDIQITVNHLRAAGAEAVAVNGQRLTSLSAIRGASEAILVDFTPLIPPYRVEAIGDVRTMQTQFARSAAASHLSLLAGTYGISVSTRVADELRLPGASTTTLRYAAVPEGLAGHDEDVSDDVTSSGSDDEGTP